MFVSNATSSSRIEFTRYLFPNAPQFLHHLFRRLVELSFTGETSPVLRRHTLEDLADCAARL
jgi:hypothetical protein